MKKKQKFLQAGSILIFFALLILISLIIFEQKRNQGYLGYFFAAQYPEINTNSSNFLDKVFSLFGEIIISLIGYTPTLLLVFLFFWQGYSLLSGRFWFMECLLSINFFLTSILYMICVGNKFYSGGILGFNVYEILTYYFEYEIVFFSIMSLFVIQAIVLLQFRGIRRVQFLYKCVNPLIKKIIDLFFVLFNNTRSFLSCCYYLMIQGIDYIFQIVLPSRTSLHEKKTFTQACQELINLRIRYINTELMCESIDAKNEAKKNVGDQESILHSQILLDQKTSKNILLDEDLFDDCSILVDAEHTQQIKNMAHLLEEKLKRCGIIGSIVGIKEGPVVTLFEYKPEGDTKLAKILNLEDDLVMALEALSIRIRAPIPGTSLVGFEIANKKRQILRFGSLILSNEYKNTTHKLPLVLGHDAQGFPAIYDLALMPHILMAGSTGSGKSVALHGFIIGLLQACSFEKLKLILIDPKRLELGYYQDIPHLLFPVVYDVARAVTVLQWVVQEMTRRYELIAQSRVRSISEYNNAFTKENQLPFIVVVIDELADLMMTGGKDIEDKIVRLAQMARASGIHLIIATQRPSVDVVTGLIKVNFTSRIALRVTSRIDSRTIIDTPGAHKLLGKGDMLFLDGSSGQLHRLHAALLTTSEIERVVAALKKLSSPHYLTFVDCSYSQGNSLLQEDIELYTEVRKFLNEVDEISISLLQRKFRIGYNRAARIIEAFQQEGIILPPDGSKVRKIIR